MGEIQYFGKVRKLSNEKHKPKFEICNEIEPKIGWEMAELCADDDGVRKDKEQPIVGYGQMGFKFKESPKHLSGR
jgi:hypothetical protein